MTETLQHKEAFEYYYSLGDKRNLASVAIQFKFSERSLFKWSKEFDWQERIIQRDINIGKSLEKKTNITVLNEKAKHLKIISEAIIRMRPVNIETVKDYETIVKLELLLLGEATEKADNEITMDFSHLTPDQIRELIKNEHTATTPTRVM